MTMRRWLLVVAGMALALVVVAARLLVDARSALRAGQISEGRGDRLEAIRHYQDAARLYLPPARMFATPWIVWRPWPRQPHRRATDPACAPRWRPNAPPSWPRDHCTFRMAPGCRISNTVWPGCWRRRGSLGCPRGQLRIQDRMAPGATDAPAGACLGPCAASPGWPRTVSAVRSDSAARAWT